MELIKVEILLEKYLEAAASIAEENELRNYFSTQNVAPHLEQYKAIFGFYTQAKQEKSGKEIVLKSKKNKTIWYSVAATIVVFLGIGTFFIMNRNAPIPESELGSYDNPEIAFKETQKALALLSMNVNVGLESVMYVQEYENAKNKVFKKQ